MLCDKWARRPKRGETLGTNKINKYLPHIEKWFNEGARNSNCKRNAAMMRKQLEVMFPTCYAIPTEQSINAKISQLFMRQKKREAEAVKGQKRQVLSNLHIEIATERRKRVSQNDRQAEVGTIQQSSTTLSVLGSEKNIMQTDSELLATATIDSRVSAPPKKKRKVMSKFYADKIFELLSVEPSIQKVLLKERLIRSLNLDINNLPVDFPGDDQLKNKLSNLRQKLKKAL